MYSVGPRTPNLEPVPIDQRALLTEIEEEPHYVQRDKSVFCVEVSI